MTPEELFKIAKTWQEGKETRSVVIVAMDGDDAEDAEDAADLVNLVSGNKRDIMLALANLIYHEQELFRLANAMAEVMKEKGKDLEGLINGE